MVSEKAGVGHDAAPGKVSPGPGPNKPKTTPINARRTLKYFTRCMYLVEINVPTRRLRRLTRSLLSKAGLHIKAKGHADLTEAHTIQFVAANTSIPVPKVYCAFCHKGSSYILMSRIKGEMACMRWGQRSEQSQQAIHRQLKSLIEELNSVKHAHLGNNRVESVIGDSVYDQRLPTHSWWGPFDSVDAFHHALISIDDFNFDTSRFSADLGKLMDFLQQAPPQTVLTHGDLSSLNIMVCGDQVTGIIDWETAGWMPCYWEYVCAKNANSRNLWWADEIDHFLEPDHEAFEADTARRRYFGDY